MEGNHDVLVAAYIQWEDGEGMIHAEILNALGGYKALWQKVSLVPAASRVGKKRFLILSFNRQVFG
jgi:hypothetical protein